MVDRITVVHGATGLSRNLDNPYDNFDNPEKFTTLYLSLTSG